MAPCDHGARRSKSLRFTFMSAMIGRSRTVRVPGRSTIARPSRVAPTVVAISSCTWVTKSRWSSGMCRGRSSSSASTLR